MGDYEIILVPLPILNVWTIYDIYDPISGAGIRQPPTPVINTKARKHERIFFPLIKFRVLRVLRVKLWEVG